MTWTTPVGPTKHTPSPPVIDREGMLLLDFVFAALNGSLDDVSDTIVVDDASQFPVNELLVKAPLYLTIESSLVHPPTFEILKLTSVDFGTNTLTVERGAQGTTPQAHDDNTLVKGALTAEIARRLRGTTMQQGRSGPPEPDSDMWSLGDRFLDTSTGTWFRFGGNSNFYQNDFLVDANNLDDTHYLSSIQCFPTSGSEFSRSMLHWRPLKGAFGCKPGQNTASVRAQDGSNVALTMLNLGDPDYWSFDSNMTAATDSSVEAGYWFGMDAQGANGYYLQYVVGEYPKLYRVLATDGGTHTLLHTFNESAVVASADATFMAVARTPAGMTVWVQCGADASNSFFRFTDVTLDAGPQGCNMGFYAKGANAITDVNLRWTYVEQWVAVRDPWPRNTSTVFNLRDNTGTEYDSTTWDLRQISSYAQQWEQLIGVWAIKANAFATPDPQMLQYDSGAVDGVALVGVDVGTKDFSVQVQFRLPDDTTADWGFFIRGSENGQNGLYLRFKDGTTSVWPILDGAIPRTSLGSVGSLPGIQVGPSLAYLNISLTGNMLVVGDIAPGNTPIDNWLEVEIPQPYQDIGGTFFGYMYRNDAAQTDTKIGLYQYFWRMDDHPMGWIPEPRYRRDGVQPDLAAPLGSIYFDQSNGDTGTVFMSLGDEYPNWKAISVSSGSGAPTIRSQGAQLYVDVSTPKLYFSAGGGGSWVEVANDATGGGGTYTPDYPVYRGDVNNPSGDHQAFPYGVDQRGDFATANGGLFESVIAPFAGPPIPDPNNYLYLVRDPESSGGTESNWVLIEDATQDTSTGIITLTHATDDSAGGFLATNGGVAFDELHFSFTMETHGDGFALTFLPITGTVPSTATLSHTADGNGAGDASAKPLSGVTINFNDRTGDITMWVDEASTNYYIGSWATGAVTPGSHDWEIYFTQIYQWSGHDYRIDIWCDGVYLPTNYFYTSNRFPKAGNLLISSLTHASGTTAANVMSNFHWIYASMMRRILVDANIPPKQPLHLLNGWTDASTAGLHPPGIFFENGRLKLRGKITGGTGKIIDLGFYGYYPAVDTVAMAVFETSGTKSVGVLDIGSSAGVTPVGSPTTIYLDGIEWIPAE